MMNKKLIFALLMATLLGCAQDHPPVNDPKSKLLLPIVQAQNDLHQKDYQAVQKDLDEAVVVANQVAKQDVVYQTKANEEKAYIALHNNDWLGARAHRDLKVALWIGIPAFAVLGAVLTYAGGLPGFANAVLTILSGGIHGLHLGVIWLLNKIHGPKTGATSHA